MGGYLLGQILSFSQWGVLNLHLCVGCNFPHKDRSLQRLDASAVPSEPEKSDILCQAQLETLKISPLEIFTRNTALNSAT